MSVRVNPSELKLAAKLTANVKDITGTKKFQWSSLHRLLAKDGHLTLYTTDGQNWLDWDIKIEEPTSDSYDIILPAPLFNDIALKSSDDISYEITEADGLLTLDQGNRHLSVRQETFKVYPQPQKTSNQEVQSWVIDSGFLNKNLKFITPFIDSENSQASKRVASWTLDGFLVGGSDRLMVCIKGLPAPLVNMSFSQKTAKAVIAFLNAIEGDVQVSYDGNHYIFECPDSFNKITVPVESVVFPSPKDLEGQETEIIKLDGPKLLSSISILSALLPSDSNRLLLDIKGSQEDSYLKLSTLDDDAKNSSDELPVIRDKFDLDENNLPKETRISVNYAVFESALKEMNGVILEGRYYHSEKLIHLEDERLNEGDTIRIAMIPIQRASAGSPKEEKKVSKEDKKSSKKEMT